MYKKDFPMNKLSGPKTEPLNITISDEDIYQAMQEISGYLDITPGDFKEIYSYAYKHAVEKIARSITAQHIMNNEVISVRCYTPLLDVARTMAEAAVSGVPVIDDAENIAGIISEKDFLYCIAGRNTQSFLSIILQFIENKHGIVHALEGKKAEDIMTAPAITVAETASVIDVIKTFKKHAINRVPVVDQNGRLHGIITRANLLRVPAGLEAD
jgi:CBS-domain-containing membrane protein